MTKFSVAMSFLAVCFAAVGTAAAPVTAIGSFTFPMTVSGTPVQILYNANLSLASSHPQVQRAVVLVHGTNRNVQNAYANLLAAAALAGANDSTCLLVAPQFVVEEDVAGFQLPPQELFWSDSGWKQGDPSLGTAAHPRPAALSSFAAMDSLLVAITTHNPKLQSVVLAGHSAGGQFVNRFAAGSTAADLLGLAGVELSFVVANPSSYLYLDAQRVIAGTLSLFAVPSAGTVQSCPDYNEYKYGLVARNPYMSHLSSSQIVTRYRDARVAVLLGELDNDPAHPDLDTSCGAMLQGANRLERGRIQGFYLQLLFGSSIAGGHRTVIVPGVGHSSHDMFTSACGVAALFGGGGCDPVGVEPAVYSGVLPARLLLTARPNPFGAQARIVYRLPAANRHATVRIYDIRGHLVRAFDTASGADGQGSVVWDGRSNTGDRMSGGVYWIRLQGGNATAVARVTLLR